MYCGQVVLYLREQLGVTRLAVHGESIGGVAAASVARHCQVSLRGDGSTCVQWFVVQFGEMLV